MARLMGDPRPLRAAQYRIRIEPHAGLWFRWYATVTHGVSALSGGWYGRTRDGVERRVRRYVAKQQREDALYSQAEEILVD
jgi:hypothetical protein